MEIEKKDPATVLLIDDQPALLSMMTEFLEKSGYRAIGALSGFEGIKIAATDLPDIILLDIMMPKMSGLDVLERLKRNKKTMGIPVIIVSVARLGADFEEASRLGAAAYITKPFDESDLLNKVREVLESNK